MATITVLSNDYDMRLASCYDYDPNSEPEHEIEFCRSKIEIDGIEVHAMICADCLYAYGELDHIDVQDVRKLDSSLWKFENTNRSLVLPEQLVGGQHGEPFFVAVVDLVDEQKKEDCPCQTGEDGLFKTRILDIKTGRTNTVNLCELCLESYDNLPYIGLHSMNYGELWDGFSGRAIDHYTPIENVFQVTNDKARRRTNKRKRQSANQQSPTKRRKL